jgi:hypothetical protein
LFLFLKEKHRSAALLVRPTNNARARKTAIRLLPAHRPIIHEPPPNTVIFSNWAER